MGKLRGMWHGLQLVENETVPADGFVITDEKDVILAGGNYASGKVFKTDAEGEGKRIHARRPHIDRLIAERDKVDTSREIAANEPRIVQ